MTKILVFFFLSFITQIVFATQNITMLFNFNYKDATSASELHNKLVMPSNNREWHVLTVSQNCGYSSHLQKSAVIPQVSGENFILLSKIESADIKKATVKFLVLSLPTQSHFIRELILTAKYNQKAELNLSVDHRQIKIEALITRSV